MVRGVRELFREAASADVCIHRPGYDCGKEGSTVLEGGGIREDFEVKNKRGQRLKCCFFRPWECIGCVVYAHSFNGSILESLIYLRILLQNNIALCSFDFSGSGNSEGDWVSLGYHQHQDLLEIILYLSARFHLRSVALWGRSMGATAVLKAAAFISKSYLTSNNSKGWISPSSRPNQTNSTSRANQCTPQPQFLTSQHFSMEALAEKLKHQENGQIFPQIVCIIADSPFCSLERLAIQIGHKYTSVPEILLKPLFYLFKRRIEEKGGFTIQSLDILPEMEGITVPVALLTSKQDTMCSSKHTEDIYTALGSKNKQVIYIKEKHNQVRGKSTIVNLIKFLKGALNLQNDKLRQIQLRNHCHTMKVQSSYSTIRNGTSIRSSRIGSPCRFREEDMANIQPEHQDSTEKGFSPQSKMRITGSYGYFAKKVSNNFDKPAKMIFGKSLCNRSLIDLKGIQRPYVLSEKKWKQLSQRDKARTQKSINLRFLQEEQRDYENLMNREIPGKLKAPIKQSSAESEKYCRIKFSMRGQVGHSKLSKIEGKQYQKIQAQLLLRQNYLGERIPVRIQENSKQYSRKALSSSNIHPPPQLNQGISKDRLPIFFPLPAPNSMLSGSIQVPQISPNLPINHHLDHQPNKQIHPIYQHPVHTLFHQSPYPCQISDPGIRDHSQVVPSTISNGQQQPKANFPTSPPKIPLASSKLSHLSPPNQLSPLFYHPSSQLKKTLMPKRTASQNLHLSVFDKPAKNTIISKKDTPQILEHPMIEKFPLSHKLFASAHNLNSHRMHSQELKKTFPNLSSSDKNRVKQSEFQSLYHQIQGKGENKFANIHEANVDMLSLEQQREVEKRNITNQKIKSRNIGNLEKIVRQKSLHKSELRKQLSFSVLQLKDTDAHTNIISQKIKMNRRFLNRMPKTTEQKISKQSHSLSIPQIPQSDKIVSSARIIQHDQRQFSGPSNYQLPSISPFRQTQEECCLLKSKHRLYWQKGQWAEIMQGGQEKESKLGIQIPASASTIDADRHLTGPKEEGIQRAAQNPEAIFQSRLGDYGRRVVADSG